MTEPREASAKTNRGNMLSSQGWPPSANCIPQDKKVDKGDRW